MKLSWDGELPPVPQVNWSMKKEFAFDKNIDLKDAISSASKILGIDVFKCFHLSITLIMQDWTKKLIYLSGSAVEKI